MSARKTPSKFKSWRDLQKTSGSKKATTKVAKQRRLVMLFRIAFIVLILTAVVAGILGIRYFSKASADLQVVEVAKRGIEVDFRTNGVLTEEWLQERLGKLLYGDIRDIEVQSVGELLEKDGQVANVTVAVSLPSRLEVSVEEREPILRIRVRNEEGEGEILLVARDGVLYRGSGYPAETLRRLPGAKGLRLRKTREGFAQLEGLNSVAYLLDHAKETIPAIYRHWRVVDLSDWNPEMEYRPSLVLIESTHIKELIFSIDHVEEQMERLAGILEHLQRNQMQLPVYIDLSFGDEAVIRYN